MLPGGVLLAAACPLAAAWRATFYKTAPVACPTAAMHSTWSRLANAPAPRSLCLPVLPLSPSLPLSLLIAYINVTTCLCRKRVARFRFDVQRVVRAALCMRSTL